MVDQAQVIEYEKEQIMDDLTVLRRQPLLNFSPLFQHQRKLSYFQLQST